MVKNPNFSNIPTSSACFKSRKMQGKFFLTVREYRKRERA